ncbi:hypothetical protein [Pontibacter sp. G13]|uniref:hypothetical protein n=1 Tax=Pontibacter sp. G13 TaxID=3074898 RepID=UPI00288AF452|nr:hypothetical protein [Pontibacter sp. G13]WNJ19013.1 hypothetical protein RJD25_00860 [Pontibacter sp. G13]
MKSKIVFFLFKHTQRLYLEYVKSDQTPWPIKTEDLKCFPEGSLGREMYQFLKDAGFQLIPKAECHDVNHVLLGVPTEEVAEICLQFILFGNGRRSKYCSLTCLIGALIYPEKWPEFHQAYLQGRSYEPFWDWDFLPLLDADLEGLRASLGIMDVPIEPSFWNEATSRSQKDQDADK